MFPENFRFKKKTPCYNEFKVRQPNSIQQGGIRMDNNSLSHKKWTCKYHIVFAPKFRRKVIFPSQKKNNKTVRVLKTPKTESSARKVFIPRSVAQYLIELKQEQDEIKAALGNEYYDYNLVMATTFGLPIGDSYLRNKMQDIIDELGLPDVVFHSLRHTSVTYKLSGGDIKAVQGDSGHAQADMVTEVYGHIIDEDRRKNAEMMENAFYNKENLNPQMRYDKGESKKIEVPEGVDAELLMEVLANPEMAALLNSLAKTMKV